MTGYIIVREPGTYRGYPHQYWGTLEEQIREATAENLKAHTGSSHTPMKLWTYAYDCAHEDPEAAGEFDGVDDLLRAWEEKNLFGLTHKDSDLYYKNHARHRYAIPEYAAYYAAKDEYDSAHDSSVCLLSPQGTCCKGCTDGDDDFGYEAGDCYRKDRAKEDQDEFYYLFSIENFQDMARRRNNAQKNA